MYRPAVNYSRRHQKEAIDFISRRETGQLASELSLWKYNDVDADEPLYGNLIYTQSSVVTNA